MESEGGWQRPDLSRELGPGVLPRQLQALEQLSHRLGDARPVPSQALRDAVASATEGAPTAAPLPVGNALAWALLLSGLAVLVLAALLAL